MENQAKRTLALTAKPPRALCLSCRRPLIACYCSFIRPFKSTPRFIILTQPREAKHSFGTGRMAHLCLSNSLLIKGVDFSEHGQLNAIIHDRKIFAVVLYPGKFSVNVSALSQEDRIAMISPAREIAVIVLDGTWKTSRKMLHLSRNLKNLPFITFDPPRPSRYRLRKQPRPNYYSTLEAIHHIIDLFSGIPDTHHQKRPHDTLLQVFDFVIERQLQYSSK